MGDHIARARDFDRKAEKKLQGWDLFGTKQEGAAELFDKAANAFKLAKSWDQAGATYLKLANCYLKLDNKYEVAYAYADAARCYKKTNIREAISCLELSVNIFMEIGTLNMSARYYKEIAELYEQEQSLDNAIDYYEKAAELFDAVNVLAFANQCRLKVAQFAAQLEMYRKAIEIYEDIARQSLRNNLLKYGVRGHLLNAGICELCKGDGVAITNALERYHNMDPTFCRTRECTLLLDLSCAIDEEDVVKFTKEVEEYDRMTQMDPWKTTLLERVEETLKAKELEEEDLT